MSCLLFQHTVEVACVRACTDVHMCMCMGEHMCVCVYVGIAV